MRAWNATPVVITVAPCGAEVTREQNPAVPYTAAEIAREVAEAAEEGATIAHLHVRNSDGSPAHSATAFTDAMSEIRATTRIVCNVSTGGAVWMTIDERLECLEAGPDMAGVETGSLNFAGDPFVTSGEDTARVIAAAEERTLPLEAECFDLGHVAEAARLHSSGAPIRLANLVLGVPGGAPATPAALQTMIGELPSELPWGVTAVGRHQQRMLALAVLLGADAIRVGLEDNIYAGKGRLAPSNRQLVANARRLVESLGRRIATLDETHDLLDMKGDR